MALDFDLMETKEFKKAIKLMGEKNAKEFIQKELADLKENISLNTVHVSSQRAATKSNKKYQELCEAKKTFDDALNDSINPHLVQINLASLVIRSRKA